MYIRTVVATFGKFWKIEILVISNSNQTKFAKYIVWRNKVLNNGSQKKKVLNNAQISEKIIMLIKMRLIMLFENIFFYKMIIYY